MTFLEPLILWGLPLALLPVIIHLFNRLRHRTVEWGAMMFLISATRKSTRYAKLRQWLILLFRVLALLVLILAIGRPLAGGWIGWMFHPAPDAIIMVLDRSASMEARMPGGNVSKRAEAIRLFSEAAKGFSETSRLVLFDTALRSPQEIGDAGSLPKLSMAAATDTASDIPGTIQTVMDWIGKNRPGNVEIWISSDMQRSNWKPDADAWTAIAAQVAALPQNVRIRMLALDLPPSGESASISIEEVNRRLRTEPPELDVVMKIDRNNPAPVTVPLTIGSDGNRSQVDLQVQGQSFTYRHKLMLDAGASSSGWGRVELPADDNPRDNVSYFVYGPPVPLKIAVVCSDLILSRLLQLASCPIQGDTNRVAEIVTPDKADSMNWSDCALVIWHAAPPKDSAARKLVNYVEQGGNVLFFANGESGQFAGVSMGNVQTAEADKAWGIGRWEDKDGLLGKTEEGMNLAVNELQIYRRQPMNGDKGVIASFQDNNAFMVRRIIGKGEVVFCAAGLQADSSNLRDGLVLVPLVQRMIHTGGRRFTQANLVNCGQIGAGAEAGWASLDGGRDARLQAGIYRAGNNLVAVNRPSAENDPESVEPAKAKTLFGRVSVQLFSGEKQGETKLQSELWRALLFIMLLFLLAEAILILPPKPEEVLKSKVTLPHGGAS